MKIAAPILCGTLAVNQSINISGIPSKVIFRMLYGLSGIDDSICNINLRFEHSRKLLTGSQFEDSGGRGCDVIPFAQRRYALPSWSRQLHVTPSFISLSLIISWFLISWLETPGWQPKITPSNIPNLCFCCNYRPISWPDTWGLIKIKFSLDISRRHFRTHVRICNVEVKKWPSKRWLYVYALFTGIFACAWMK